MRKKKLLIMYLISSCIWIYGSNYLVDRFVPTSLIYWTDRLKELLYVIVTGWFIFYISKKVEELNTSKEEEKRLSTLINSMVDFVNFKDGDGRWIEANEFGLKLFQLEHVEYRGKKDSELAEYSEFYADALRYCEKSDEVAWQNGKVTRIEENIPLPNGSIKTFDTIKVPLFNEDGNRQGLVIIGRDITERKHVENLLEESQQQYKSLFEYSPDILYMLDLKGRITNLNPQFEIITGYKKDDMIGKCISYLLSDQYKDFIPEYISHVESDKKPRIHEIELKHADGFMLTLQCTSLPIIVDGKIAGIIGYGKDVTALRKAEEQLLRTEKLSVVGELSASVAHEIRNPLTSLKGFVQILQTEDRKHQFYYQIMLDELNRINHIVGELLLLAKPQHLKFEKADIGKILIDVISLLNTEASLYNILLDYQLAETEIWAECEPNQLKQLFINLIKNAIEASHSGDIVSVCLKKPESNRILITVKDHGEGITSERLKRIGEPFYSSKEKGTGLGLTVSFKIVESHNGNIQFDSEKGKGTTVLIELPMKNEMTVTTPS